ncbi:MAG: Stk1 family PASTA domain-containing Ser/Thr kinase, partial [Clostridium sp.]|nr:Stk1 family PASTA domain-containing Ser/Thr kinase [Clostridium sp.]
MDQYIGKLLDNRYEVLELIGVGGMARVYKARCHRLNRLVAIKILRDDLAQDAEFRRRFHDESQAVAMLSHPNIMAVYDVSRASEMEYIVMELIDGVTLKQYMQKKGNKLNWREALHFITQITKALGHAHSRGIIHRDIKPHNIMVLRDGSVKVADFGIARVTSGGHSTLTQEALGSVHYISPEQARGSRIDARSDLYSAGVVLYEMITGRLPFEGDTPVSVAIQHINSIPLSPREIDPSIPEALEAITMKAMAPNPSNRYSSAGKMLADLEEFRKNPNINFDYKQADILTKEADADEDRTRLVPPPIRETPQHSDRPHRRPQAERIEDEEEEDGRRSGGFPWPVIGAVLAILLFVGGLFYLITTVMTGFITPSETYYEVPSLVGELFKDVEDDQSLLGDHFTVAVSGSKEDENAPAGTILYQDPEAGTQEKEGTTEIRVTISSGSGSFEMIDVTNMPYETALTMLSNLGLDVITPPEYRTSSEIEENRVIEFTPQKGAPVSKGDQVNLVISSGPDTPKVTVINFIGQTRSWAEDKLNLMNLECKFIESYSDEYPAGEVFDQNPVQGTEVDQGSTVNLQVSLGPDPATHPKEVTMDVSVAIPDTGEMVNIKVIMDGEIVFTQVVDTLMEMGDVTFSVVGSGTKELQVYYNDVFDHV